MAAYYIKINGKNYDKKLIDIAKSLSSGKGDGRLSLNDAKAVLKSVKDSDEYTDIEKTTISYIRDNFKFTKESDAWFRTEIRRWAAMKSTSRKKTEPKKRTAVKKAQIAKKPVPVKKAAAKKTAVKKPVPVKKAAVKKKAVVKKTSPAKKAVIVKKAVPKKSVPARKAPVKKAVPAAAVKKEPQRDFMAEIISQGNVEAPKTKAAPKKSSFSKIVWVIVILLIVALGVYLFFPNVISTISNKMKSQTQSVKQVQVDDKQVKKADEKKPEIIKPVIEEKKVVAPEKKEIIPVKKVEPKQEDLTGYYIVKEKDSLIDIAKKEYGDFNKWKDIYDLNIKEIVKPSLIYTGQKLKMPKKK